MDLLVYFEEYKKLRYFRFFFNGLFFKYLIALAMVVDVICSLWWKYGGVRGYVFNWKGMFEMEGGV